MIWRQLLAALMGTVIVEVLGVLADYRQRVPLVVDQHMVEVLLAQTAAPTVR